MRLALRVRGSRVRTRLALFAFRHGIPNYLELTLLEFRVAVDAAKKRISS